MFNNSEFLLKHQTNSKCISPIIPQVRAFLKPPMLGVVLQTYGSGNAPNNRDDLITEIKKATRRGVLIINCTQCLHGPVVDQYATGKVSFNISWFS